MQQALASLEAAPADLLVSSLQLAGGGGIELAKQVWSRWPDVRVVIFSGLGEGRHALRALSAGALGYVTKSEPAEVLATAIVQVLDGRVYVSPQVKRRLVCHLVPNRPPPSTIDELSDRELEVFRHVGRGLKRSEIAAEMNLSVKTVDSYRARIGQKMRLPTSSMLQRAAVLALWEDERLGAEPPRGDGSARAGQVSVVPSRARVEAPVEALEWTVETGG